jgi:hypothetical protein
MKPGYAIFLALVFSYAALLVVSYWAGKLSKGLSGKGLLLTFLLSFVGIFLMCLLASPQLLTTALIAVVAIVFLTLIIFWITG